VPKRYHILPPFQLSNDLKTLPLYTLHWNDAEHLILSSLESQAQTIGDFQEIYTLNQSHHSGYEKTGSAEYTVWQL
jgi:hypothetical protein